MTTNNAINASRTFLQSVSNTLLTAATQTTIIPYDDSIPQNTEGDEVITLSITPISATSILEIVFTSCNLVAVSGQTVVTIALFRDSTASAISAKAMIVGGTFGNAGYLNFFDNSGSTSSTTYKIRMGPSATGSTRVNAISGGTQLFDGVAQTILQITEYGP